jgi:hypothetical protein
MKNSKSKYTKAKKKWQKPAITEVDIERRELMEKFGGGGLRCMCTTPTG